MSNDTFLDLTIYPHRSLSKEGFRLLMLLVIFLCMTGGIIFWQMGAWPVFGFFGLDILLIFIAFKINYRSGRVNEKFTIKEKKFVISRNFPSGKTQIWNLNPYWAKAELIKNNNESRLLISSKEKKVSVGSFLNSLAKIKLHQKINYTLKLYKSSSNI